MNMGEEVIILKDNNHWEIKKLKRFGSLLIDKMTGKAYAVDGSNKIRIYKGKKAKTYYLLDEEKGVSIAPEIVRAINEGDEFNVKPNPVRIEKDETVIKLKTNPELIYQAIEGGLLLKLFRIKPTMGQVVAGIILGLIIGAIIGGILF